MRNSIIFIKLLKIETRCFYCTVLQLCWDFKIVWLLSWEWSYVLERFNPIVYASPTNTSIFVGRPTLPQELPFDYPIDDWSDLDENLDGEFDGEFDDELIWEDSGSMKDCDSLEGSETGNEIEKLTIAAKQSEWQQDEHGEEHVFDYSDIPLGSNHNEDNLETISLHPDDSLFDEDVDDNNEPEDSHDSRGRARIRWSILGVDRIGVFLK